MMPFFNSRPLVRLLMLALTAGLLLGGVMPGEANHSASSVQAEVLREVNAFRARNGLAPLRLNDQLNQAAQRHSNDMAARQSLSHLCKDGTTLTERVSAAGYPWRVVAENVGSGQMSARQVVQAWINSPGHRANMLQKNIRDMGVGLNRRYWTLNLAG